ncbi:MAG: SH3 domain-containing protein [Pyrinomonadaceae bacterium]
MSRQAPVVALACCCLSLLLAASAPAQEVKLNEAVRKITTVSAVRARRGPQVAAPEVTRLKLGTTVSAVARSAGEEEIGGKKDYWYLVSLPAGESGWVFGGLLADYDPARRAEIIRRIIDGRMKVEEMSFEDGADFYNFVSGALAEAGGADARGELELLRLHALDRSVRALPFAERERPPYRDWYKAHEREIYYHELADALFVRAEQFWDLERKYRGSAVGDRIAWEAAQNPLPGECEGDEVCQFLRLSNTEVRYLSLYPDGEHAGGVLRNFESALASEDLKSTLNSKGGDRYLAESRAALRKALAELRAVVSKSSAPEKASVLSRLNLLVPGGR